ncbi:MAG: MFS transporter [Lachnospiraceae bacterium]|nr:MFS transporter [Lachnospiraceae bacterium]
MMDPANHNEKFPVRLILPYLAFYAGQALFGSYRNLYFESIGFSKGEMGVINSVGILVALLFQPIWAAVSDRTRNRPRILILLFGACALFAMGFYISKIYWIILLVNAVFYIFFQSVPSLMDSYTLEFLEARRSRFDFANIRLGGTLGYAVAVYLIGRLIDTAYQKVFWLSSVFMVLAAFSMLGLRPVRQSSKEKTAEERGSVREIFRNRIIVTLLLIHLVHALGSGLYHGYYALHFKTFSDSAKVALLLGLTALSELPWWPVAGKIIQKLGVKKAMTLSLFLTAVRFVLLSYITSSWAAILINLTTGFCFVINTSCTVMYIDREVPRNLRTTGQSVINMSTTIIASVIGGALMGYLCVWFGIPAVMLGSGIVLGIVGMMILLFVKELKTERADLRKE